MKSIIGISSMLILLCAPQAAFSASNENSCEVVYEDCKIRPFADKSSCRLSYDQCLVSGASLSGSAPRIKKTTSTDEPRKKKKFEL
jgi:hypothetical protein